MSKGSVLSNLPLFHTAVVISYAHDVTPGSRILFTKPVSVLTCLVGFFKPHYTFLSLMFLENTSFTAPRGVAGVAAMSLLCH